MKYRGLGLASWSWSHTLGLGYHVVLTLPEMWSGNHDLGLKMKNRLHLDLGHTVIIWILSDVINVSFSLSLHTAYTYNT